MTLNFTVSGQKLVYLGVHKIVSDTINYIGAEFTFNTPDWEGVSKWVHFSKDGAEPFEPINLDENDSIPDTYGLNLTAGHWDVWLHGDIAGEVPSTVVKRITTGTIGLEVAYFGGIDGSTPLPVITPSVAEQIDAKATRAEKAKITSASVTVNASTGTPSASVTIGGVDYAHSLDFVFSNLKGRGITSIVFGQDNVLTITLDDGEVITYNAIANAITSMETLEDTVEAAETSRATAETSRATAETARANAETSRATAESGRVVAESLRITEELEREQAETSRVTAESSRVLAETGRVSAETGRSTAESGRASAETGRVNAETGRVTAENAREANKIVGASATIDANTGTPSVAVTESAHTGGGKDLNFAFHNIKGSQGEKGDKGESGVYTGSTTPTDPDITVWIDPSGTPSLIGADMVSFADATVYAAGTAGKAIKDRVKEPEYEGSMGQVLATNGDGTRYWKTVSGGGTSDYADLTNKPTINNAELLGNKTSAQLGVADAVHTHTKSAITDFPVNVSSFTNDAGYLTAHQSLSAYRTSADQDVIDDAQDEEIASKYEKPATGIPSTDLASAVQTSLGKADTALQEHQSLTAYRTSAAQDVIDAAQDANITAKYTKPSGGIPSTDMTTEVQTSLGKADTALQEHQSLAAYRTATAQDTIDNAQNADIVALTNTVTSHSSQIVLLNSTVSGHTTDILNLQRRTKNNITSNLANLPTAIAQQNLEKYGYAIGDYFVGASGYTYWLADMDTYYGGYNSYAVVGTHHCAVVVDTKSSSQWDSASTAPRYDASALHTYLSGTVLNNVKSDLNALFGSWSSHIISHEMLANGIGTWGWSGANYIRAMTELEIYGSRVWSADNYQQGEAVKQLELFRKFRFNEIFGNTWFWLRSLSSSSNACAADNNGRASYAGVTYSARASGIILLY